MVSASTTEWCKKIVARPRNKCRKWCKKLKCRKAHFETFSYSIMRRMEETGSEKRGYLQGQVSFRWQFLGYKIEGYQDGPTTYDLQSRLQQSRLWVSSFGSQCNSRSKHFWFTIQAINGTHSFISPSKFI